ncbi:MAG: amidohydrolase [Bacillota bacterium]|nr:amidohydrolase [Bacillota bacterium]
MISGDFGDFNELEQQLDTLYYNGVVYTADRDDRTAEAVGIRNGKIVFIGSNFEADKYKTTASELINLEGKMVLPGFIDSHLHAPGRILTDLYNISLYEAFDVESILDKVKEFVRKHPDHSIIYGEGFSLGLFTGDEVSRGPGKERLDQVCSDRPIVLFSSDCHLAWLNSKAFELFGINEQTPDPPGGIIERDPISGKLWGTLKESAMQMIPEQQFTTEQIERALVHFQQYLHSFGYTGIHSVSISAEPPLDSFHVMEKEGWLKLHVRSSVTIDPDKDLETQFDNLSKLKDRYSLDLHRVTTAKFFTDGVIEGATAFLSEPYEAGAGKKPGYRGEFLWDRKKLADAFKLALDAGIQVHVHSIGDASTRLVLDALESAGPTEKIRRNRNSITHLQLIDPSDIPRFKKLNVIASVQPYWHCKEPGWWHNVDNYFLGHRAETEYPLQSFFNAGVIVASSSDHPVTAVPDPLRALRAGITRNLTDEERYGLERIGTADDPPYLLNMKERATLPAMIKSLTVNGAYMLFTDDQTGTIEVGKWADLVILDQNLFDLDPLDFGQARVIRTVFKGDTVFISES